MSQSTQYQQNKLAGEFHIGSWGGTDIAGCVCQAGYSRAGDRCVGCGPGFEKRKWGLETCSSCASGKYSEFTNASTQCIFCPEGKAGHRQGDETACRICSHGKYAYSLGNTACLVCPTGSFNPLNESGSCTSCPGGKAGTVTNATSETTGCAIFCSPGTYSQPKNIYPYVFPTECVECAVGTYSSRYQSSSCTSCPSGSLSPAASINLTNCSCNG